MIYKMEYKYIAQKPYCCVPASLSMILQRRGLDAPDQDDIAYDLGIVLPEEHKGLLRRSHNSPKAKSGFGTRIHLKPYSLTSFFKKRKYKLKEKYVPASRFKTAEDFKNFLKLNEQNGNDQLICFNQGMLLGKTVSWGHCTVVSKVSEKMVFMYDPSTKRKTPLRKVLIRKLYEATKNHYKGGVWVISSTQ